MSEKRVAAFSDRDHGRVCDGSDVWRSSLHFGKEFFDPEGEDSSSLRKKAAS